MILAKSVHPSAFGSVTGGNPSSQKAPYDVTGFPSPPPPKKKNVSQVLLYIFHKSTVGSLVCFLLEYCNNVI